MAHHENMIERLPQLYRDGERVRGLMGPPAVGLEILDEDGRAVQCAHFFDSALELREAEMLGAILDIPAEPWQNLATYRAWVHALRNARLEHGAVTVEAIVRFVADYARGYQDAVNLAIVGSIPADPGGWRLIPPIEGPSEEDAPIDIWTWRNVRATSLPVFVENPSRTFYQRAPAESPIEPLQRFTITQRGLDETYAGFLLLGIPSATEHVPTIINLTTGEAIVYLGSIPTGARLWIRPRPDGTAAASLDGVNVSDRLYSVAGVAPGVAWEVSQAQRPARAMRLARGENDFWFMPLAHYGAPGLDRVLLALSDLLMEQGRYDESVFDRALFYQDPGVLLTVGWVETQPARFAVRLPAGILRRPVPQGTQDAVEARTEAEAARDQLLAALQQGVDRLRAAGIRSEVHFDAFAEEQPQQDRLVAVLPKTFREGAPTGADRLSEAGGLFDVTGYNDSTYR